MPLLTTPPPPHSLTHTHLTPIHSPPHQLRVLASLICPKIYLSASSCDLMLHSFVFSRWFSTSLRSFLPWPDATFVNLRMTQCISGYLHPPGWPDAIFSESQGDLMLPWPYLAVQSFPPPHHESALKLFPTFQSQFTKSYPYIYLTSNSNDKAVSNAPLHGRKRV